jgi:putative MATE family efflux protein
MSYPIARARRRHLAVWAEVTRLAMPMVASAGFSLLSQFTDTAVMGWVSVDGLAGVAAATAIYAVVWATVSAVATAHQITAARAFGAGDPATVGRSLRHSLLIVLVVSLPLAVGMFALDERLVALMTGPTAAASEGGAYLGIRAFDLLLSAPLALVTCTFVARKEPKKAMYAFAVANLVNVTLDVVLVLGLGWGAAGNALATLIGTVAATALALAQLRRWPARGDLQFTRGGWHWREARTVVQLGAPLTASALLDYVGILVVFAMLSRLGTYDLAAGRVDYTLMFMFFVVFRAFGNAAQVLLGHAVGAADGVRVDQVRAGAISLLVATTGTLGTVILLFPAFVLGTVSRFDGVVESATPGIRVVAGFLPVMGVAIVGSAALRAVARPKLDMVANVVPVWLVQVPLTALLTIGWRMGSAGVFLGFGAYWAGRALIATGYWTRERRRLAAEFDLAVSRGPAATAGSVAAASSAS